MPKSVRLGRGSGCCENCGCLRARRPNPQLTGKSSLIYCTRVVNNGASDMTKAIDTTRLVGTVRATVSFPENHYAELERIARENKVSVAWVVREAVEKYLVDRWPLFPEGK